MKIACEAAIFVKGNQQKLTYGKLSTLKPKPEFYAISA